MVEFAEPRIIRTAEARDVEALQKHLPKGGTEKHAERWQRQVSGDATYVLAVQAEVPVGHLLLKWNGATDGPVAESDYKGIPDIEDLYVEEAHRNRNVASRLLETAERLARERGYKQIGLSCSKENTSAQALYEKRGYVDSGIAPYTLKGTYTDAEGKPQEWTEPDCRYFVRTLASQAETKTETSMENNDTTTETTPEAAAAETPTEDSGKTPEKPITDQVVDFAFGMALTAAETLEKAVQTLGEKAKVAQKEAPAFWESMQEKGRPAREKLVYSLREETKEETDAATRAKEEEPETESVEAPASVAEPAPIKPAPRPFGFGRSSSLTAEEEIKALEDRVKALEKEVTVVPASADTAVVTSEASDFPTIGEDVINPGAPTPAEQGTVLVDFTPETSSGEALTDSPYAITDEEERAAVPSQLATPDPVEEPVAEAETPAVEAGEPSLAPAKGRRTRKTTSEASAGTDPADENAPEAGESAE